MARSGATKQSTDHRASRFITWIATPSLALRLAMTWQPGETLNRQIRSRARRVLRFIPGSPRPPGSDPRVSRDDGSTGAQLALNRKAHPAAAGGDRIRVLHPERLAHQVVDEIKLGALEHFERDRIDQDRRAVARHRHIVLGPASVDIERILEARAAAALDRNPQRRALVALEDRIQTPRGAGADRYPLKRRRDSLIHGSGP